MHFNQAYDPFRALGSAWKLLRVAPLSILVGGGLLLLTDLPAYLFEDHGTGFKFEQRGEFGELRPVVVAAAVLLGLLLFVALLLFSSLVRLGYARAVERALAEGSQDVGDLFQARGRFVTMLLTRLLVFLVWFAASLPFGFVAAIAVLGDTELGLHGLGSVVGIVGALLYLPCFVYFVLGVSLATEAVAIEGMQPTEALARSWELVRRHRMVLLLYLVVTGLAAVLGVLACCIGLFVSYPLMRAGWYESYLRLVREGEPETWHAKPVAESPTPGA